MNRMTAARRFLVTATLLVAPCVQALAANTPSEVAGAKDHPVVSRYAGSVLQQVSEESFAAVRIPASPGRFVADKLEFDKSQTVEGKVSGYFYVAPASRSALEVFRNYQQALAQAGFTTLFSCEMRACDLALIKDHYANEAVRPRHWMKNLSNPSGSIDRDVRFVSARQSRNGTEIDVVLYVAEPNSLWGAPTAALLVVEPAAMDTGKVVVATDQLQSTLASDGKIALYGIYFDTGTAVLRSQSTPQLVEMAGLLNSNKSLKVFVVGHTDSQGSVDANLTLSQRRAEAVVAALVRDYKIETARVSARGVANFAPVASNASEAGKARNRRVELVVQ